MVTQKKNNGIYHGIKSHECPVGQRGFDFHECPRGFVGEKTAVTFSTPIIKV